MMEAAVHCFLLPSHEHLWFYSSSGGKAQVDCSDCSRSIYKSVPYGCLVLLIKKFEGLSLFCLGFNILL